MLAVVNHDRGSYQACEAAERSDHDHDRKAPWPLLTCLIRGQVQSTPIHKRNLNFVHLS